MDSNHHFARINLSQFVTPDEETKHLEYILRSHPTTPYVYRTLARRQLHQSQGMPEVLKAEDYLKQALKVDPLAASCEVLYDLALVQAKYRGAFQSARVLLRKTIDSSPDEHLIDRAKHLLALLPVQKHK